MTATAEAPSTTPATAATPATPVTPPSTQAPPTQAEPRKFAGKYETPEALETAYKELERKLGQRPQQALGMSIATPPPEGEDFDPTEVLAKAGLKPDDVYKQWQETGDLTDEQFTAIRRVRQNLGKADIRAIARGITAERELDGFRQERMRSDAAAMVGGDDKLQMLLDNGSTFIPKDEIDGLQKLLSDSKTYKVAVRAIMAHHEAYIKSSGSKPLINGGPAASGPISSREEYRKVLELVVKGDVNAKARLMATKDSEIAKWK